jgi:ABC-type antimicrobial peptide transport system permease subunit
MRNSFVSSKTLLRGWLSTSALGLLSAVPLIGHLLAPRRYALLRDWLNKAVLLSLLGGVFGLILAKWGTTAALTRLMASMLFGVKPTDPITFGAVIAVLCGIASFACYVPARRAAKVDPMAALRYE